jgi:hypothetical protein
MASEKNDNYFKIKQSAALCLQTLFKICNKAFTPQSLWLLVFPSILTSPQPYVLAAIDSPTIGDLVSQFCKNDLLNEPTLFSIAKSTEDCPSKLRGQVISSISILIENTDLF